MKSRLLFWVLTLVMAFPAMSWGVKESDFELRSAREFAELCKTAPGDPLHRESIHFCHGYIVGAYDYYAAVNAGPEGDRLVCLPQPPPSRNEIVAGFLDWSKAHPQHMNEKPVEALFMFLMEKWPCKR